MNYPRFEDLGIAPDFLLIGASAMRGLVEYGWLERKVLPANIPLASFDIKQRKAYQSNYIGVSRRYNGYCGHWAPAPGKYVRGPVRPTEEAAARDRALALGLDYLEVRV